ncbi:MAG: glycoside hydrolase family 104 protein, partial [Flavobacterium sp.]
EGHTGDKDKKLLTSEQLGTSFKNSFPVLGKYRVEGYGKPKNEDFEKGKFDKNYPDCSIDIEVTNNKLVGDELLPIDGENFTKAIGGKMRLRQNFPASFKAKFLMPPTDQELEQLRLYVTDGSGNTIDSVKVDYTVSFTPINTKAQYKIIAEYKLDSGEVLTQSFTAETITNSVAAITHTAEVIRPGTAMSFSVKEGTFSFYVPDDEAADAAIGKELQQVKWNLNGRLLGAGKSIAIPGHEFMSKGKYVVEAYVQKANAYGTTAKDEEDDWRFEVKDNDVLAFSYIGAPKVGKTTRLEVSSFVFANVLETEQVVWQTAIPHKTLDKKTISITPAVAGKQNITCGINREPGVTLNIDVKQAKVLGMLFTDSNGIEIQRASWGQKVNIWVRQEHLTDEDIIVEVWDSDTFDGNDSVAIINKNKYDGGLISFALDGIVKQKTGDWGKLYVKIGAPKLKLANTNAIFESENYLDVQDKREIYAAHIGSQDGKDRHYHTDYDKISYFYAKSRGIKTDEQLNLTIYEKDKELLVATVHVDESGMIKVKLEWNLISLKVPMRIVHAVVKDKDGNVLYNGARTAPGLLVITKKSALLGLAEYKSAVLVGKEDASSHSKGENKNVACECEAKVRAFLRTLKKKEGFAGDDGYETNCGGKSFIKDYGKDWSKHPDYSVWIERIGKFSDAAGAYQIMEKTWNDTGMKEKRLWYGVTDFKPLNQDKFAVILLKYKRLSKISDKNLKKLGWDKKYGEAYGDIIKAILDNDLDKAILISGLEWASLPGSPYGQEDTNYTNKDFKDLYNDYLKKELNGDTDLKLKKGFLRDFGYSHCIPFNALDGITTYRIYNTGAIEKHIPLKIKQGFESQYKYIYIDANENEHEICLIKKHEIIKKENGKRWGNLKPNHSKIVSDDPVSEGQTERRVKYENGDIAEYGKNKGVYFWNLYQCTIGSPSIELVKMPDSLNNTNLGIIYEFSNTQRRYTSPGAFAGFIGALAECKYSDIITTGSCFKEGTCFPSVAHVNGKSIDTLYVSREKEIKFISAMTLFKFNDNITGSDGTHTYENTKNKSDHNDHLHSGFDESSIIIIKQK